MQEIKSREENPIPGVKYSEIHIADRQNIGTGRFTTLLEDRALKKINPIISSIQNEPAFLLIVSINIAIHQVTAMIGKSHTSPPIDRKVFTIPQEIDLIQENNITVYFKNWNIQHIDLNQSRLSPSEQ